MSVKTVSLLENLRNTLTKSGLMPNVGTQNKSNRDLWLAKTLRQIPAGYRILDAGAGEQQYKRFCKHLSYFSQDFAQYTGKGNEKGLQVGFWDQSKLNIISDISSIPIIDGSFDAIMCIEVFEHLPDPLQALGEFERLLRPGGYLIITAPFCSLTHFAPFHYSTGFNRYYYEKHLKSYGFHIIDLESNGNYFEYLAQELLRLPSVQQKYAKSYKLDPVDYLSIYKCLLLLDRLSKNGGGSSEILNFGYNVLAEKIGCNKNKLKSSE